MKKFKHIVPILLALVMTMAIALSGCDSCNKTPEPEVTTSLQSVTLDTSSVKTNYYLGEQFNAGGLVVKAVLQKSDSDTPYEETLGSGQYTIDSSAYNANVVGTYSIKVSYTYEEVTKDASFDVTVSGIALSLDTSAVQTLFLTTEEFNSDNLVVDRIITTVSGSTPARLTANDYTVDSSKYKKVEGSYVITVSHIYDGNRVTAEYTVQVIEPRQGLAVSLKADVENTIVLSSELTSANLSEAASWIEVKQPDSYGVVAADAPVLDGSKYTVSVYKGQQKIETLTGLAGGAYQIWAEIPAESEGGFALKGFVIVYVVDDLVSLTMKSGATLTQPAGADKISSTWKFIATYASGATKDLTIDDVKVDGLDTKTAGTGLKATVTYTEANAKGVEAAKTAEVTYTITPAGSASTVTNELSIDKNTWSYTADTDLTQADFTGDKAFLTLVEGGTVKFRPEQSSGSIEIKKDAFQVTFTGTGKLTIECMSTGGNNTSDIAVKDASGNFVACTSAGAVADTNKDGYYTVSGTSAKALEFDITAAGTYTITACCDATTGAVHNRNTRIKSIKAVDIIGGGSSSTPVDHTYRFDVEALANVAKGDGAWTDKMTVNAEMFTGANAFLTFSGESTDKLNNIRTGSSNTKITGFEMKGGALSVTFQGTGTLAITFCANSGNNTSALGLKNAAGSFIAGTPSDTTNVITGEDNMYAVAGTSTSYTVTFTITEAGTYTIWAGNTTYDRVARVSGIVMIDTYADASSPSVSEHNNRFDVEALANVAKGDGAWTDKMTVNAEMFTGANAFLTFSGESTDKLNNIRTGSSNTKITGFEMKGGALSVTFQGTGTLAITFCANSGNNTSALGLKNAAGSFIAGTPSDTTNVIAGEDNMYAVAGSSTSYTVTFTITEAGTYTIWAGNTTYDRVARVSGIAMVDNY